ncbi:unnamed protein product [Nippostrongylus brasiliensis]|uniref:Gelsolin-like domain-containing protein n=1 Tax=Nippostrongylus brasiliensis TaxID=27835 RepID=A0A0N4YAU5_NIPBR|nr:unnamed protein product [Nippostrongylus brasiliensis]
MDMYVSVCVYVCEVTCEKCFVIDPTSVFSLWVTEKENTDVDIVNDELLLLIRLDSFQILFEECNHGYGVDFEHSNYGGSLITWRIG